jgi:hypothetical protein
LKGLPKGKYMLALGQLIDPASIDQAFAGLDPYFELPPEAEGVDQDQLTKLKDQLKAWAKLHTGFCGSIEALPPGPGGLIGATFIFDTTNSAKWLEGFTQLVEGCKKLVTDEEVQQVLNGLTHDPQAEASGNVKVQHLKFDLSTLEEAEEEWLEDVFAVAGKDGLLLRLAAVDDKKVVLAFGGGAARMKQVIEHARKSDAPLESDLGIKHVGKVLPKSRNSVGYVAVDNIVLLARDITKALDEDEEFPLEVTEINAPLAISGRGGEGWSQADIFVPTELMIWAKDTIFTMMGMGAGVTAEVEMEMETEAEEAEGER